MGYRVAVASTDGLVVNEHFGRATSFYIIEVKEDDLEFSCIERRTVTRVCEGGDHEEEALEKAIERLKDCQYVVVSKIGYRAQEALAMAGIEAYEIPGLIKQSIKKLVAYIEVQQLLTKER